MVAVPKGVVDLQPVDVRASGDEITKGESASPNWHRESIQGVDEGASLFQLANEEVVDRITRFGQSVLRGRDIAPIAPA